MGPNRAGAAKWEHVPTMFLVPASNIRARRNQTLSSFDWLPPPQNEWNITLK